MPKCNCSRITVIAVFCHISLQDKICWRELDGAVVKTSALQEDPSLVGSQHTLQVACNHNPSDFCAHRHSNAHAYMQTGNEEPNLKTNKQTKNNQTNLFLL